MTGPQGLTLVNIHTVITFYHVSLALDLWRDGHRIVFSLKAIINDSR